MLVVVYCIFVFVRCVLLVGWLVVVCVLFRFVFVVVSCMRFVGWLVGVCCLLFVACYSLRVVCSLVSVVYCL